MPKNKKEFLALDVKSFLEKIKSEQLRYGSSLKHSEEVWERYEFLIAAVEAERFVNAVPAEEYYELERKKFPAKKKGKLK